MKNGWKRIFAFDETKWRSNMVGSTAENDAVTFSFEDVSPLSGFRFPGWKRLAFALPPEPPVPCACRLAATRPFFFPPNRFWVQFQIFSPAFKLNW